MGTGSWNGKRWSPSVYRRFRSGWITVNPNLRPSETTVSNTVEIARRLPSKVRNSRASVKLTTRWVVLYHRPLDSNQGVAKVVAPSRHTEFAGLQRQATIPFGIAPQGFRPVTKKLPIRYNFGTFEKRELRWFSVQATPVKPFSIFDRPLRKQGAAGSSPSTSTNHMHC